MRENKQSGVRVKFIISLNSIVIIFLFPKAGHWKCIDFVNLLWDQNYWLLYNCMCAFTFTWFNYQLFPLFCRYLIAGFYTETITLNLSTSKNWQTRIECRAFLVDDEHSVVPCCNKSNHKTLCQPDTGIARLILDIVAQSNPNATMYYCKPGVNLNSVLPLMNECPLFSQPKYCPVKGATKLNG